ncbi:hypothetical protein QQS21_012395 [Conoideocrella luteorostrata]|uniref:Terpenoid synthase n=1 Tax=Conoideocrella luteorostrata TaxID=1105319 RepID=A0AAJ0CDL6_9HYPO|nr:hypothetical protein QQS21_012395 [Conoideocrella luteorostrata]
MDHNHNLLNSGKPLMPEEEGRRADDALSGPTPVSSSIIPSEKLANSHIRVSIARFLDLCGLVYPKSSSHLEFTAHCIQESMDRGYVTPTNDSFKLFIPAGVAMACTAYGHQPLNVQVFICFYTAFAIYVDDMSSKDIMAVEQFNHRFVTGQPQSLELLDHFAALLKLVPDVFSPIAANIITTSTLDFITAQLLENAVKDHKLETSADRFPIFCRDMSSASRAYAMFIPPPEVPLIYFLQALPDCAIFFSNGNDILSCYKEQVAGEEVNLICLAAQCRGVHQDVILQELIEQTSKAHHRVLDVLRPCSASLSAYVSFSQGYIGFHTSLSRYKLDELGLYGEA